MPAPAPTALVTGSSRGIGRAIAVALAARGVRVVLHGATRSAAALETLAALGARPPAGPGSPGHHLLAGDLADPAAAARVWEQAVSLMGRIDILVNNAAVYELHPPLTTSYRAWQEAWTRTLGPNLIAPANLCLLASQAMAAAGGGRIVNVSSRGAFRGEPEAPAYGASKAALNALGQSLARALASSAVYVYTLAPGWVETDMAAGHLAGPDGPSILAQHPLGRVARPSEIADAAVFCALDAPAAMTGAILDLNGASYLRT